MNPLRRFMDWMFGQTGTRELNIPGLISVPTAQWRSVNHDASYISPGNALAISAVFACVRVLAESVASLPLKLYRRVGQGKETAHDHPLYTRLHDLANPEMSAFEFRETMMAHLLLWGNCYAEIEMNQRADVLALWPLIPSRMRSIQRDCHGRLQYHYDDPKLGPVVLDGYRVFHIRGLSSNGIIGLSPIAVVHNAIRLAANIEHFGVAFYDNGAAPGGILEHPGKLSDEAYRRLKTSWEERHRGAANAHRVAILEEGMKWSSVGMPLTDAQFLESRRFQVAEIARIYRVPPHLIQDLDRATFNNIEHMSLDFVVHSLRPWLVRWEQAIARSLLGDVERRTYFAEFSVEGLLRGDVESRYRAYSVGRQWGWLSRNDIRRLENMNPIEGGDDYLTPLNMSTLGPGQVSDRSVLWRWIGDALQRIETRCDADRDMTRHGVWVRDVLRPIVQACVPLESSDAVLEDLIGRWSAGADYCEIGVMLYNLGTTR